MKRRILEISILLICSLTIIFYQFNQIPKNLSFDEVEFARLALHLDKVPYTPYSPLATGHSTLYFYLILFSFKLFGITSFALRMPAAIFGVLSVLLFYLLMEKVFDSKKIPIPFFLTLIFVTMRWYFNFARYGFEATFLLSLELSALFFLFAYFKNKNRLFLLLSGIFCGLAFHSYLPGRIFFIVPLFFLLIKSRRNLKSILYFVIPFILVISPLVFYLFSHTDTRVNQQFFPVNTELTLPEKIGFFWNNIVSFVSNFFVQGDINARHNYPGKPALNPIIAIFFIYGFVLSIIKKSDFPNQLFLAYFAISSIPSLLTYPWENPNMLRTFTVIPSIVYFMGISVISLEELVSKRWKKYLMVSLILLFLVSCSYEIRTYFLYQSSTFNQAFDAVGTLKENLLNPPYGK